MRNLIDVLAQLAVCSADVPTEKVSSFFRGARAGVKFALLRCSREQVAEYYDLEPAGISTGGFRDGFRVGFDFVGLNHAETFSDELRNAQFRGGLDDLPEGDAFIKLVAELEESQEKPAEPMSYGAQVVTLHRGMRMPEITPRADTSGDEWRLLRAIELLRTAYESSERFDREEALVCAFVILKRLTAEIRGGAA